MRMNSIMTVIEKLLDGYVLLRMSSLKVIPIRWESIKRNTEKDLKMKFLPCSSGKRYLPKEISVKPTTPQDKSVACLEWVSLYTDNTVKAAAQYAYDNYLGKPLPDQLNQHLPILAVKWCTDNIMGFPILYGPWLMLN